MNSTIRLIGIFLVLGFFSFNSSAQNRNGITGYGGLKYFVTNAKFSNDHYLAAEGGVIVNDNLQLGTFLNALIKPYFFDYFSEISANPDETPVNPYSNNKDALTTNINNIEVGINVGLNIAPAKTFQANFKAGIGYSIASFNDLVLTSDSTGVLGFELEEFTANGSGFNFNVMGIFQFKVGSSMKIGIPIGYRFSYLTGKSKGLYTEKKNVFAAPKMFSGFTWGIELTFGSF